MKKFLLSPLLLSLSFLACGGGGGGGGTGPTAPPPPPTPTILLLNAAVVSLSGGGMEEGSFRLDGREVFHPVCNPAGSCLMTATLHDVPAGAHTVTIQVVRQNRASVTYQVLGQVDFGSSATNARTIPLELRQVTLRAGEAVTYNISL